MNKADTYIVGWCSNEPVLVNCDFASFINEQENHQKLSSTTSVDMYVLDIRFFQNIRDMQSAYMGYSPALILVSSEQEEAEVLGWIGLHDDVCRYTVSPEQVKYRISRICSKVNIDTLTGLASRKKFQQCLQQIKNELKSEGEATLIFLDIDNFKFINDQHGHVIGDQILKEFADLLNMNFSNARVISRLGGNEFTVLLVQNEQDSLELAESFRKNVKSHIFGEECAMTVSIGVSTFSSPYDFDMLIQRANEALYAAKANGRNSVVSHNILSDSAYHDGEDIGVKNFENLTRVLSERAANLITNRGRKILKSLRKEADIDGLTKIYNRKYFNSRIEREFDNAKKYNRPLTIALLDIDYFGNFNKDYGVLIGDRVLKALCDTVLEHIRTVDWFARYGGEEFCLIMPDTQLQQAQDVINRIHQAIRALEVDSDDEKRLNITVSIGLVELLATDKSTDDLIRRASDQLIIAKESGRDKISIGSL